MKKSTTNTPEAIKFLIWCADNGWYRNGKSDEWYQIPKQNNNKTAAELYKLFSPAPSPVPDSSSKDESSVNWDYEIIPSDGEIHIFDVKDKTVAIASIYAQPLGPEEYQRANLICAAPAMYAALQKCIVGIIGMMPTNVAADNPIHMTAYNAYHNAKALLSTINQSK